MRITLNREGTFRRRPASNRSIDVYSSNCKNRDASAAAEIQCLNSLSPGQIAGDARLSPALVGGSVSVSDSFGTSIGTSIGISISYYYYCYKSAQSWWQMAGFAGAKFLSPLSRLREGEDRQGRHGIEDGTGPRLGAAKL